MRGLIFKRGVENIFKKGEGGGGGRLNKHFEKRVNVFSFSLTTVAKRSFFNLPGILDPSFDCDEFVLY